MNEDDVRALTEQVASYWQASDSRIAGIVRWLRDNKVTRDDASRALSALAGQYDTLPSIHQLGQKLAEVGASVQKPLGVGHRAVIESMKQSILEGPYGKGGARDVATRTDITLRRRLELEKDETERQLAGDAAADIDTAWLRDRLAAYDELLREYR